MKKRVFLALKMSGVAGQLKLAGISHYLNERYHSESPWEITLVRTRAELTRDVVEKALAEGTEGFVISIPGTEESLGPVGATDTPTIVMDVHSPLLEKRERNLVTIRNSAEQIGKTAAQYLMGQGTALSYAFIHPETPTEWSKARCKAFSEALAEKGIWCEELFTPQDALRLKRPAAVFAANDDSAHTLLKFLACKRMRVPRDIAVLGVDNDTLVCEHTNPPLSSVMPDFESEGYMAAKVLDEMMHGKPPEKKLYYADIKDIVRRKSTSNLSVAGALVQKALVYIDRHALEGIDVNDVVKHLK